MIKLVLSSYLFFISGNFVFAQKDVIKKIEAIKNGIEKPINRFVKNAEDSISLICDNNYIQALTKVQEIYKKQNNANPNFTELWKNAAFNNSEENQRNLLIAAILNNNDSALTSQLGKCDIVTFVPFKQTSCCAIDAHYEYDSTKSKNIHPLVLTALTVNNLYQSKSQYGKSKLEEGLLQAVGVELVNNNLIYSTINGYRKNVPDKQKETTSTTVETKVQKEEKKPIWLWLLGGFVIAVVLFFALNKKKETS